MTRMTLKRQVGTIAAVAVAAAGVTAAHSAWDAKSGNSGDCSICRAEATLFSSDANAESSVPIKDKMAAGTSTPVLVELFTSEGCSSCPPADTLLQELQKDQPISGAHIIALGEHVDYWDRNGWKDPYSSAAFSARQSEYAQSFKNNQVYTPQMVVDGKAEFVGSDRNAAQAAISHATKLPKVTVTITQTGDSVSVSVAALPKGTRTSDVYAAVAENNLTSSVRRGENAGRRLTHTAVARQLVRLGTISAGKPFESAFHPKATGAKNEQSIIAFVQEQGTRRVLGAAETSTKN